MYRKLLYIIYTIIISANAWAYDNNDTRRFQYIGTQNGLPDGKITSLMVDHRGALWIGTDAGLAQYDGYRTMKVSDYEVSEIYEDCEDNLWIHSGNMILRYLRQEHRIDNDTEKYLTGIGIDNTTKEFVFTDGDRHLWILTRKSLYCYDAANGRLRTVTAALPQWRGSEYHSVADDGDYIYVCDRGKSLWKVSKNTGKVRQVTIPADLAGCRARIYADHSGTLWIYSTLSELLYRHVGGGIWRNVPLPKDTGSPLLPGTNAIHQLADNGNGRVWIATDHRGVFCYDAEKNAVTQHIMAYGGWGDMAENNVNTIAVDKNDNLWLGHYKRGISYSSPGFNMFNRFAEDCGDVSALLADRNGTLWIGTDGKGLFRSTADGGFSAAQLRDMVVASLIQDHAGRIWAGTYNSGLYCIDNGRITEYSVRKGNLPTNMSWKIAEDRAGQIWVCSAFHPLLRLDPATGRYTYYNNKDGSHVYGLSMTKDRHGRIYVGTSYGVYIVDPATGRHEMVFGNKAGNRRFQNQQIMSLFHDSRGILWMGHYTGMTAWDMKTDSVWCFTTGQRGICNNLVKSIQEDRKGNIWVSTAGGISRVSVADRQAGKFYVTNYRNIVGNYNNYFNQNASALTADGTVLFGCVNGYVGTRPLLHTRSVGTPPQLYFSAVTVGGQPLDENAGKTDLRYNDHTIVFRLMTDNPANASEMSYAYCIDGKGEWIYINSPEISFASLPSGNYTLRVKACNGDGVWSKERIMVICVAPPLWRSPLMIFIYLLIAAAAVAWYTSYTRRNNRRKIEQEKQSMEQEKNIRIAEMKLRFFTNVSHDLRTPLTLIISPLQTLINEKLPEGIARRLQIMEKNARLLQEQINTLLDFRRLDVGAERLQLQNADIVEFIRGECGQFSSYATDRGITFSFNSDTESLRTEFDSDKVHKIIYNLLSNAFKYTPDGKAIAVTLRRLPHEVEISVADSGPGVADKDKTLIFERFYQSARNGTASDTQHITGSGIGLHIVSEYIHLMQGSITVSDGADGGAVFTCRIPAEETRERVYGAAREKADSAVDAFTVLIVDDNKDMCEFIGTSLEDHYRVLTAGNGADALELLRRENVSLVVSDVMMPVMDGLELCRSIKNDVQLSHIPVILLTAKTAESSVMDGYETGADDYITKPFNIDMLKLRINKFIELAKMNHKQFRKEVEVSPNEITTTPLDEQFIKQAMEIVEAHISDSDFSVEALGQELAMNRVALWKKLQAITGKGPMDFIRAIRMKRGRQLLDQGQMNISEIAYSVGYNTVKRFTENFKAEFGMTPSEYKKRK